MDKDTRTALIIASTVIGAGGWYLFKNNQGAQRVTTGLALSGLAYSILTTLDMPNAAAQLPANRNDIPVLTQGAAAGVRNGSRFTADLSQTLVSQNPAVKTPGTSFVALGDVDQSGVHQGFQAFVHAKHEQTGEEVDVPISKILQVMT